MTTDIERPFYLPTILKMRAQFGALAPLGATETILNHGRTSVIERRDTPVLVSSVARLGPDPSKAEVSASGLLDVAWYLKSYSDVAMAGVDPVKHFTETGWLENRNPNGYFDFAFYAGQVSRETRDGENLLLHYIRHGDVAGLRPSIFFDPAWYRAQNGISANRLALSHYLEHAATGEFSPTPFFDVAFYLSENQDVRDAGIDPFLHFFQAGCREGRNPSAEFNTTFYTRRYLSDRSDEHPFIHYLKHCEDPDIVTRPPQGAKTWSSELKRFSTPGPAFEDIKSFAKSMQPRAKVLAYYLPQYHAFPENDRWWGEGFTEWTNLARGAPRFEDHYQPRVPRDLGFYNILSPGVLKRQIDLAQAAGIFGFVFYFYWFKRQRLMEAPVESFLADASLAMPFCLMWANENWTRRWDGLENDVLISQDYADEDDDALVETWLRHFRDPRYIRIDGRPVLMIYRPGIIPGARAKISDWRRKIVENGEKDPVMIMAQGFNDTNPVKYGFDGAIEFPPHKVASGMNGINRELNLLDPDFAGMVFSYDAIVERSIGEDEPVFPLIKTAFPSWDNDARRQGSGMVIHGSTPDKYQAWLERLISNAVHHPFMGERFVCINAWNEWAEAAYLEPDQHYGAAYLNATARAVFARPKTSGKKVCIVGHDAHPHGAQMLVQNLAKIFCRQFGIDLEIVTLGGGRLLSAYRDIARTTVATGENDLRSVFRQLFQKDVRHVIVNSAASSRAVAHASASGLQVVMLVHELPSLIREKKLAPQIMEAIPFVQRTLFPAEFVRDKFVDAFAIDRERTAILPQGSYNSIVYSPVQRDRVRGELGVAVGEMLVLGVGFADLRKGFDLFLAAWRASERLAARVHFAWVGQIEDGIRTYLGGEIDVARASGRFHTIPFTREIAGYYAAADAFLLTSREDPFPTVVLEAMQAGLPTICFEDSGGIPEMVQRYDAGHVVKMADVDGINAAVSAVRARWPADTRLDNSLSRIGHEVFSFSDYAFELLKLKPGGCVKISVIVPNYNYARYLRARLESIFGQTYPIFELIVLDDRSTDDSMTTIGDIQRESGREFSIVANAVNSGSVFHQWRKGTEIARGDYVWIAESDDEAAPELLERLAGMISDNNDVVLAYSDSRTVDENNRELSPSYKFYYNECSPGVFDEDQVFSGQDFIRDHLSERNLILNVSACLWKRAALLEAFDATDTMLPNFRVAGDWLLYVQLLWKSSGHVAYVAQPLNVHRRHSGSVTHSKVNAVSQIDEIRKIQTMVRDIFPENDTLSRKQDSYYQRVAEQLGVELG